MASVAIRDVRKAFGKTEAIHGVDISIKDGEFVVLVGPWGAANRLPAHDRGAGKYHRW